MKKNILILLSLCLIMVSCQKETVPSIILNQTEFSVSDAGGSQTISFESNLSWTAKSSESWCNISPASGDAFTKSTTITVATNDTYDTRSCTVTITVEGLSKTLTVNQSANLSLLVTQGKYDITNDPTTIEVEVKANVDFEVIIPEAAKSWVSYTPTRALRTETFSLFITKNESYDARTTKIYVKDKVSSLQDTITINQYPNLGLLVTKDKYDLSNDATTIEVEIKANVEFDVTISDDWISRVTTRGLSSTKLRFNIAKNKSFDNRNGSITIKQKDGDLVSNIKIYQSQLDAIILSNKTQSLSSKNQALEVELKTNVDFEVIIPEVAKSWVSYTPTRALRTEKLLLNIAENRGYDSRTTKIYVKNKLTSLQDTLTINQSANLTLLVTKDKYDLSNDATTIEVEVKSNIEFDVTISDNWISRVTTRGLTSSKLQFNITKNSSYDNRNGSITLKQNGGRLTRTIKVYQSQEDAIILSNKSANLSSDNQTLEVELKTNVDFEVIIPTAAKGWVSYTPTRVLRTEMVLLNITENKGGKARATEVYIKNKTTTLQDTLKINQDKIPVLPIVATPVISPNGGSYTTPQTVTIKCATAGALIRYTLDGSEPIETSTLYTGGIPIDHEVTIKAKAFKFKWEESSVATQTYIVKLSSLLIEGSSNEIQHINTPRNFTLRLDNLDDKNVFFVFSNNNTQNSTALPHLQSNVPTMKSVKNSTAFSEPSFLVSGKPSITDFNNNPLKYPMDGMSKPEYQQYSVSQPERQVVGSSQVFYDDIGIPQLSTVRKIISAQGKNLYVWVADNCWGTKSTKTYFVTQQMVDALASKFLNTGTDNDIYEWVTNICGAPWGKTGKNNLIPETDDIHIWLTDIDNDNKTSGQVTLGYFYARDNYLKSSISTSNEKLMFTIDAVLFATTTNGIWDVSHYMPKILISTLAHEFTHMIYFYQNNILNNQTGNTTISEMTAQCVEDLVANKILANGPRGVLYSTSNSGNPGNSTGRFPLFNANNDYNLLNWSLDPSEGLVNYSKTYALGSYLMRNYGGAKFIRELIQNNSTGVNSIVNAVNSNGGAGLNYEDILQRFGAAYLLSDKRTLTPGYRFNAGGWSSSTINGITYNLGSINFYNYSPPPYVFNELPTTQKPGSNIYYRAGRNLSGTKEWSFEGMNPDTKLTVVIK